MPPSRSHTHRIMEEAETLSTLAQYGIPVVTSLQADSASAATAAADRIGYPVVLKGLVPNTAHKSDANLVHLNLPNATSVRSAVEQLQADADPDCPMAYSIQPQLTGPRELIAGFVRDPIFGPVVMVGIGGVLTEAVADTVFGLPPLNEAEASNMIDRLRSRQLLGRFRGQSAIHRPTLVNIITGLSRLAESAPHIQEVDINPFIVNGQGMPTAVDALMVVGSGPEPPIRPSIDAATLLKMFEPRSIAYVGASAAIGKWGQVLSAQNATGGFDGKVYLVNPKGGSIAGRPVYADLDAIDGDVDLAVITIPADRVPPLIPSLKKKGVTHMVLISSGFSETGPDGRRKEHRLMTAAEAAGIVVLGPNTMGLCNPHHHFYCTGSPVAPQSGSTAMVSQSGNLGTQLLAFAEAQGIGIRLFAGTGNEGMVSVVDFLDALASDTATDVVLVYLESITDGPRFFTTASRLSNVKPLVLLKGGTSTAGRRAAESHTGALASDQRVFESVCNQAGIIRVDTPMALLDVSAAFASLPLPPGNRVGVVTLGGGWGVVTADLCGFHGLELPPLPESIVSGLDELLPSYWSRANPIDIVGIPDPRVPIAALEQLMAWEGCDAVIHLGILGRRHFARRIMNDIRIWDPTRATGELDAFEQMANDYEIDLTRRICQLMATYNKPVLGVRLLTAPEDLMVDPNSEGSYHGVCFETPERAVYALAKMVEYRRHQTLVNGPKASSRK